MPALACNACNIEFSDEAVQKAHYRSDWHRYNLKRKVAGVPGVTEGLFNLRVEALAAEKKKAEGERLLYKCSLCGKEYSTEKAHTQHLQSKLHISKAAALEDSSRAGLAVIRPAPVRPVKEEPTTAERREENEESDEDWEEVDSDEVEDSVMELRTDGDGPDVPSSSGEVIDEEWDASRCFICGLQPDASIESCVEHMHKAHGFFIPDAEYLKDVQGLLSYLGLKVTKGHMCLYCDDRGKRFHSVEAVRKHMISKSHCKLRYGDGEGAAEEELEDFYDFSSSYVGPDGMQLVKVDDGEDAPAVLVSGGLELMLKGDETEGKLSRTIGSRELFRYYKQRPKPSDQRDGMVVNAIIARYRSMGLATREATPRYHKSADGKKTRASRLDHMHTQVGLKHNVIWNLPKNVPF
ncbi:hypothetical protein R1sor_008359 [Riccia sorocarpa]|uniref:C2H2-type domain-containing protein n=1 Tax=Riccia sorocarpa TaxID=122646 RepID=A0ABD3HTC9_9MARC